MSIMNFGRIRDLVSNLGWKENENSYTFGADCLDALEQIENELLNEDVINRHVHLSLHICGAVKKNLIPVMQHGKCNKCIAAATRVLVNLAVPVKYLSPVEDSLLTAKGQNIRNKLILASFEIKKAFLDDRSTFPIVAMLREAMIKSEKYNMTLNEDDCAHLKNCLILLQHILHLPEESELTGKTSYSFKHYQDVQNKTIWNLFVQNIDGALLLMLNSKYRLHWTIPLAQIIVLLYKNQNLTKVHETLELISSASDTSCDEEESDGSKNSSKSLSSKSSKANKPISDSGCALASDSSTSLNDDTDFVRTDLTYVHASDSYNIDIHTKLEKVQISDDSEPQINLKSVYNKHNQFYEEVDSESSSCSESPQHKKIKGSASYNEQEIFMDEGTDNSSKNDSGVMENMDRSSPDIREKSSDDDIDDKKLIKTFKAVQRLRSLQIHAKISESDSSNEDMQNTKIKYRNHPPAGRRGKSPRRKNGCTPSVCMDSAIAASVARGRIKYPLWEKRSSVTTLVDINSAAPSDEDIGYLIKEFTMSFLHSGFSYLVLDLKNFVLEGSVIIIDKSLLFWMLSYFLHLASTVQLSVSHISNILTVEIIGYLVYECVLICENVELHFEANIKTKKELFNQLKLIVTALKEMMMAIDMYSKSNLPKERLFFLDLCGKLCQLQHLQYIPLLLLQNCCKIGGKKFTEDVVILNHYILAVIEKSLDMCPESKKKSLLHHLKQLVFFLFF